MNIKNLFDIFILIDELYRYLENKKMAFDDEGFPVFEKSMFLDEWPDMVVPFSQRKNRVVTNPRRTVLCFFEKDERLYPRLGKLFDELDEYKKYMGVIGLDVTITDNMDEEWQKAIAQLNQLFLAVLAVNGVKIITNTRTAGLAPGEIFNSIPNGVMAASGYLGCDVLVSSSDYSYLAKILTLMPNKLIIYGKHDEKAEHQLRAFGIDYRVYTDFHRMCKEKKHG